MTAKVQAYRTKPVRYWGNLTRTSVLWYNSLGSEEVHRG